MGRIAWNSRTGMPLAAITPAAAWAEIPQGVDPAVVADGHPPGGGLRPLRQDHLGKGLGGVADHMNVHPPQARPSPHGSGRCRTPRPKNRSSISWGSWAMASNSAFSAWERGPTAQPALVFLLIGHRQSPFEVTVTCGTGFRW